MFFNCYKHCFLITFLLCLSLGECLVTGQAHYKTFDNKFFTFSGICQYLLAKDCQSNSFSVIIETAQVWNLPYGIYTLVLFLGCVLMVVFSCLSVLMTKMLSAHGQLHWGSRIWPIRQCASSMGVWSLWMEWMCRRP